MISQRTVFIIVFVLSFLLSAWVLALLSGVAIQILSRAGLI